MVMERAQRIDDITRTMNIIIDAKISDARRKMDILARMPDILNNKMANLKRGVEHNGQMLNSLGYKNVLARGYAIARAANGAIISSIDAAQPIASIEFADGIKKI